MSLDVVRDVCFPTVGWTAGLYALGLQRNGRCRFSRSSTGSFSRMFVMGWTRFPGLGGALSGEGAVV